MFLTFKILVIHLIISSRCANIPPPARSNEKTTLSFEEQVKKELSPVANSLKSILDPLTRNDEKLVQKGVVQGEVRKIIERAVKAETENKMLIKYQGVLETEKAVEKIKNDQVVIPLSIRHFAAIIEGECPIANVQVPHNTTLQVTKDFTKNDVNHTYHWLQIIQTYGTTNKYVKCLCKELEDYFKKGNGITKIDGIWILEYDNLKLEFCKSIVRAINYGNKLVAHMESIGVFKESLLVYPIYVDRLMTVFYNALMGHK